MKIKSKKSVAIGIIALILVSGVVTNLDKEKKSKEEPTVKVEAKKEEVKKEEKKVEKTKKEEPKKAEASTLKGVELTVDNIKNAIKPYFKNDFKVTINEEKGKKIIDVTYNPGEVFNDKSFLVSNSLTATNVFEVLFTNETIDKAWVWTETEFIDAKGNKSIQPAVNVALTKENAKDINWSEFKDMVKIDYNRLYNIADEKFIHPSLKK